MIFTHLSCIEERKERHNSDTERHGIPPQSPWFFYVPGVQLRYTGPTLYVPIRLTMVHTMNKYMYNEKMNDMWELAPGIESGSSAWKSRRGSLSTFEVWTKLTNTHSISESVHRVRKEQLIWYRAANQISFLVWSFIAKCLTHFSHGVLVHVAND